MKTVFICLGSAFLGLAAILLYSEWKTNVRFNWNCFIAGAMSVLAGIYLSAKPLLPGKTYHMTNGGLVEVLPSHPQN